MGHGGPGDVGVHQHDGVVDLGREAHGKVDRRVRLALSHQGTGDHHEIRVGHGRAVVADRIADQRTLDDAELVSGERTRGVRRHDPGGSECGQIEIDLA